MSNPTFQHMERSGFQIRAFYRVFNEINKKNVLHSYVRIFIEPPPDTQQTERQGERGIWVVVCYFLL
jgi:hypothetical protein